jgi:NAD(P)-dependent dehydrogenase (short-subunit alcohol dehydrogenase family)
VPEPASLAGDVAVVTGAGKGIGEAIAQALAAAGARVAVTSRVAADAERVAVALGPGHVGLGMDVRSSAAVDEAVTAVCEAIGAPTILVNNAGVNRIGPSESYPDDDWELVLDVNLTGVFRCCRAAGARMLEAGGGSIVNVASIIGATVGMPWRAPYAASKAGVVGLTRTLAVEWADRGVRVNAVLPGPVRTAMVADAIERGAVDEKLVVDHTPAGRLGLPADIANAVVLLSAPGAGFVTGQAIVVDGGYSTYGAAHPASRRFGGPDA